MERRRPPGDSDPPETFFGAFFHPNPIKNQSSPLASRSIPRNPSNGADLGSAGGQLAPPPFHEGNLLTFLSALGVASRRKTGRLASVNQERRTFKGGIIEALRLSRSAVGCQGCSKSA